MKKNILKTLACVNCHANTFKLRVSSHTSEIINEGLIECSNCSYSYPIIDGIPCFLPREIWDAEIKLAMMMITSKPLFDIEVNEI